MPRICLNGSYYNTGDYHPFASEQEHKTYLRLGFGLQLSPVAAELKQQLLQNGWKNWQAGDTHWFFTPQLINDRNTLDTLTQNQVLVQNLGAPGPLAVLKAVDQLTESDLPWVLGQNSNLALVQINTLSCQRRIWVPALRPGYQLNQISSQNLFWADLLSDQLNAWSS